MMDRRGTPGVVGSRAFALLAAFAVLAFAAGCGSSSGSGIPAPPAAQGGARFLASAATKSTATPSMKTDLTVTMLSSQLPGGRMQMTATGEETGRLEEMLARTADFYEQRVSAKVDGLSSLVEPVAIMLLGIVIALMLVALYLPIFNLGHAMRSGLLGPS